MENKVDIKENYIHELNDKLLEILLKDHSSNKNILWATDNYKHKGTGYYAHDNITVKAITRRNGLVIKPRVEKSKKEQDLRIKQKAEVFTPSWICNDMANNLDETWFEKQGVFNTKNDKTWTVNTNKIPFTNKTWQDYVKLKVLEISCGEAPFLVSRYDTVTGKWLDVNERIGMLDRKLRVVNENTDNVNDWLYWATEAYKATFGYEWQGDSLLIARENLLFTFIDYYSDRFNSKPTDDQLIEIAKILSWNIWQMDGLKYVIPNSCKPVPKMQLSLFPEDEKVEECPSCKKGNNHSHTGIYSKIMNWHTKRSIKFYKGEKKMKFDFVIGNPPYQVCRDTTKDMPVYHEFIDAANTLSDKVELITPARFLFNAGATPKVWNKKMLQDEHFKVLHYESNSTKIFPNTLIEGGIAIHYRDTTKSYGAIQNFTAFDELNRIKNAVVSIQNYVSLNTIMFPYSSYTLADGLWIDFPEKKKEVEYIARHRSELNKEEKEGKLSNLRIITSNIFDLLPELFFDSEPEDGNEYVCLYGRQNYEHTRKYILKKYISVGENYSKWKVLISKSNGASGTLCDEAARLITTPFVIEPNVGYTQTFLGVGSVNSQQEANAICKYIKTKFCRVLLGILKITQDNAPDKWQFVPLQDFTDKSDIDWSKSIKEIDKQLYEKYGLEDNEINFIETHVKEMN